MSNENSMLIDFAIVKARKYQIKSSNLFAESEVKA